MCNLFLIVGITLRFLNKKKYDIPQRVPFRFPNARSCLTLTLYTVCHDLSHATLMLI